MSTQLQKKRKATVEFTSTAGGKLDESQIDSEEHTLSDHYLFGEGDTKSDYSYPVVSAEKTLKRGNVDSAWQMGARGGVDEDKLKSRLKTLGKEFDSNPIPEDAYEDGRGDKFLKTGEFVTKDETEQIAYGAVLVPNRVDHQGDFFRPDAIADLAANFSERVDERDAVPGVMHSVFPSDVDLAESRVTDEAIELGDKSLPEGSWVIGWKFTDDELWSLVNDKILKGYSMGGTIDRDSTIRYGADEHPDDVEFPDEVAAALDEEGMDPDEVPIREITAGRILEVSAVDTPAVPDATHEEYKGAGLEKGHPALTDSLISARLYLEDRGHSEEEARRLAEYLDAEKDRDGGGWIARAKRFFSGESGGSGGESALQQSRAPGESTEKDGRTLSQANIASAKAVHDAALDMLSRSDVDHGKGRFTDDPGDEFDVGSYGASGQESGKSRSGESGRGADLQELMNTDEFEDVLKDIQTTQEELNERMGALETEDNEQTEVKVEDTESGVVVTAEGGELSEEQQKAIEDAVGGGEDTDPDRVDELSEQVGTLAEATKETNELVERMADANGVSQQADTGGSDERADNGKIESMDDLNGVLG